MGPLSKRGMPLGLIVARYFAYVLAGASALVIVMALSLDLLFSSGALLRADYGASHADELASRIGEADEMDPETLASPYRYALFSTEGDFEQGDMASSQLSLAAALVGSEQERTDASFWSVIGAATVYRSVEMKDGRWCVIAYDYMPQFSDKALRDALPNPQSAALACLIGGVALIIAACAARASFVISRTMQPLVASAHRIAEQDLDFAVKRGDIRQINEVLAAMDLMRASLKASLEEGWEAQARHRRQAAALAHDLKTPLTVIRANAELLMEEEGLGREAREEAKAVARASMQLDEYLQLLMDSILDPMPAQAQEDGGRDSANEGGLWTRARTKPVPCVEFLDELEEAARSLAAAHGLRFRLVREGDCEGFLQADRTSLQRACMNIVDNASSHSPADGRIEIRARKAVEAEEPPRALLGKEPQTDAKSMGETLILSFSDEGPGFSPQALAHGTEALFTGDESRAQPDAARHYGIGLTYASEVIRSLEGSIELGNRSDEDRRVTGARLIIKLPLSS